MVQMVQYQKGTEAHRVHFIKSVVERLGFDEARSWWKNDGGGEAVDDRTWLFFGNMIVKLRKKRKMNSSYLGRVYVWKDGEDEETDLMRMTGDRSSGISY